MNILIVMLLAIIQGIAELLPVSSSAHVIVAEKLLGIDPTMPAMTFLLVMLHTGTMFAVLVFFWNRWRSLLSKSNPKRGTFIGMLALATVFSGTLGLGLQWLIEKVLLGRTKGAAVEDLFGNLWLIGGALGVVGILIIIAGYRRKENRDGNKNHSLLSAAWVGLIQGLSLPFRGFSRSGATISLGLLSGMSKPFAEEFSFFLALIVTVPVVGRESLRLRDFNGASSGTAGLPWLMGFLGLVFSFGAGLFAIRWLSSWLEKGRWGWFGLYCLIASALILGLRAFGWLI
jgi:undecaprenyl-diphosphatase